MQKLPETAPDVYRAFTPANFSVKRTPGEFNSAGVDMCLEQTINRSSKGKGGVIGVTKRKYFVSMWNLICHEMLAVSNLSRTISGIKLKHGELAVSHEFTKAETDRQKCNITNMIKYVLSIENPRYVSNNTERRLHNILTQEILPNDVSQDLKNLFQIGTALCKDFRNKRFLDKTEKLSDTIQRWNLKNFKTTRSQQAKQKKADTAKK